MRGQSDPVQHQGRPTNAPRQPSDIIMHIELYTLERAMKQATFTEIRNQARAWFDLVESGETVRVLRNGKPIADIVPIAGDLPSWKRRRAQPLLIKGVSISDLIVQDRAGGDVTYKPRVSIRAPSESA